MKKSTLLVGLALVAGCGLANAQEEINGLKMSDPDAGTYYYYQISNMRAQRLNYVNGDIIASPEDPEDVINNDGATSAVGLPEYLPDGTTETPQIYTYPYMGLCEYNGSFLAAFSAQENIVDRNSCYWYFTKGKAAGAVNVHNAAIDGVLKRNSVKVADVKGSNRSTTGFSTDSENERYYVIAVKDYFDELGWDIVDDENVNLSEAFAFSANPQICVDDDPTNLGNNGNCCLDMNNYIFYTEAVETDEIDEETEEPIVNYYGFAGADRTWNPLQDDQSGRNNCNINNGSLWFVSEADNATVEAAVKAYSEKVIAAYQTAAAQAAETAKAEVISQAEGYLNVPALWTDKAALQAVIDQINNMKVDVTNVKTLEDVEKAQAAASAEAKQLLINATILAGNGAEITLCNTLALRDWEAYDNEEDADGFYQIGNGYLSANDEAQATVNQFGGIYFTGGSQVDGEYPCVAAYLEASAYSTWIMEYVEGTNGFRLKNKETGKYIRKYGDWADVIANAQGVEVEDVDIEGAANFTWALTDDANVAAAFTFVGCPAADQQSELNEPNQTIVDTYEVPTDIENNVYLRYFYTDEDGDEVSQSIHRASGSYNYTFVNWNPENNRWYADSNTFTVNVLKAGTEIEGGIQSVEVAPVADGAIYDIQGRRVNNATRGLYIINGKKVIVK